MIVATIVTKLDAEMSLADLHSSNVKMIDVYLVAGNVTQKTIVEMDRMKVRNTY